MKRIWKRTAAIAAAMALLAPCLLIFDGGPDAPNGEEHLQWTNVVGVAYAFVLYLTVAARTRIRE